jgi:alpha-galactosidase
VLIGDILSFPELADARLALFEIDAERLATTETVARRLATGLGTKVEIESTSDRAKALDGADYAINMIQVGDRPCTVTDFAIPKRHGLEQTIGDTLGIGGTCGHSGPFRCYSKCAGTWSACARTCFTSTTPTQWR